jgi:hypothetical protein
MDYTQYDKDLCKSRAPLQAEIRLTTRSFHEKYSFLLIREQKNILQQEWSDVSSKL